MLRPDEKNECSHSGKLTFSFGEEVQRTHTQLSSQQIRYINNPPHTAASSSLSEWLTCLSVLGWKQETCPPFWGGTTDWHLECSSPLINVNLLSKFAIGSVFLGQHFFFAVFLPVVSCLFRNIGKCGKACPPEEDAFKIWSLVFKQTL